jgi:hypothetical protein
MVWHLCSHEIARLHVAWTNECFVVIGLAYISFNVTELNIMRLAVYIFKQVYNLIQFIDYVLIVSLFVKCT